MKRTTKRWIWIGAILLLLVIEAVLFFGRPGGDDGDVSGSGDGVMQEGAAQSTR